MPTYVWNNSKGIWESRGAPILAFSRKNYKFYVPDEIRGEVIHGRALRAIDERDYEEAHGNGTAHAVLSADAAALMQANKAAFRDPQKVVVVGMDQWVITDLQKNSAVCTSGIIGCIGIVLIAGGRVCVTHVLDGFLAIPDGFEHVPDGPDKRDLMVLRREYRQSLDDMLAAMGRVDRAIFVASSSVYVYKCKILADWLKESNFAGMVLQQIGGGFIMRVTGDTWEITLKDKPATEYHDRCCVVSAADLFLVRKGELSEKAADSGG